MGKEKGGRLAEVLGAYRAGVMAERRAHRTREARKSPSGGLNIDPSIGCIRVRLDGGPPIDCHKIDFSIIKPDEHGRGRRDTN